jgi:hypothetical protein
MKNKKKYISEAAAEAMGLGSYAQDATGKGDFDLQGRGSMIAQPAISAPPAATPTAPMAMAGASEEMEEEEGEEGGEDELLVKPTPTSMPYETTEEVKHQFRNALVSLLGEDVDASLITQLEAVFEAAVSDRVEKTVAHIVENVDGNVKEYLENVTESLVEKVDDYLDYVVEEWMTENAVAVEQGIKTQIAENFIHGLKNLFENHYIDVPSEKYNVLDDLYAQNRELENKLNESVKYNMNLKKEIELTECAGIFVAETRDLADTQVAKLQSLMENVNFTTSEEYREKLVAIRENYMSSRPMPARTIEPEQSFAPVKQIPTTLVEGYAGAIGRLNKKI